MKDIWELAISPQVLPLTVLLAPVALYWLLHLLGAVDLDFLGAEIDADGPAEKDGLFNSWLQGALRFVNATEVPVMIVLSVLAILLWAVAMIGNLWFNPNQGALAGGIIAGASLVAAIALTRFAIAPLKPFFRLIRADDEKLPPVVGRTGTVRTAVVDERGGQVEIENSEAPLLLNARVATGSPPLPRHTPVIVIHHDPESGIHTVRSLSEPLPPQQP